MPNASSLKVTKTIGTQSILKALLCIVTTNFETVRKHPGFRLDASTHFQFGLRLQVSISTALGVRLRGSRRT